MAADRAMMEEVVADERKLWDQERAIMKARISELEVQLHIALEGHPSNTHPTYRRAVVAANRSTSSESKAGSTAGSHDGSSHRAVPQESGRDADGIPFYAPAPQNPNRSFDVLEASNLRVDSITTKIEDPIRVTSKELTASDFGHSSPTNIHSPEKIPELSTKSIDISQLQPNLDGVAIRASAVSPTFVAKVLSPQKSPQKLSPDIKFSPRNDSNLSPVSSSSREERAKKTLEVAIQPVTRRLTMHAGHTPNHSITNFTSLLGTDGESGSATPTQAHHDLTEHAHHHSNFTLGTSEDGTDDAYDEPEEEDNGDKELSGPLGFTNDADDDDPFLKTLVGKLEEIKKSSELAPGSERSDESVVSRDDTCDDNDSDDEEKDEEGPKLKLKSSSNFGKPLGQA